MFSSNTSQVADGGYQISRSLRFNSADNAYLIRTPASAGNRKTWTWSAWVKRSELGVRQQLFNARPGSSEVIEFFDETISVFEYTGASIYNIRTNQVFRDPSAWYHIVVFKDTTQATDTNRMKVYVNGVQITSLMTASYPTLNSESYINSTVDHHIGCTVPTALHFGGYMAEINFIDGQALTPSSFGETNAQTGVWQPKAYSGSYGTNGFYLNFSDNSNTTAATLGKDYSGNGNNWTPNNFSVTAGAGNDSLVDTPTPYGSDSGTGGAVRGNYATLNPLDAILNGGSLSNGNLDGSDSSTTGNGGVRGTVGVSSGKWYWEVVVNTSSAFPSTYTYSMIGVSDLNFSLPSAGWATANGWAYYAASGNKYNGSNSAYGAQYNVGDVIGVALDMDAGTLTFYKNNVSQGQAYSGLTGKNLAPYIANANGTITFTANFGQRPFVYTAPSGFKALCTQNLPTPTIGATTATQAGKYFNPVLYTGNSTVRSITGVGFQPDFTWIKRRDVADDHYLFDAVRTATKYLNSNLTATETTNANSLTSFDSDGFGLGISSTTNSNANTFVAWNWKANGAGSTNTAGSITSTVSANTTSGFSIVNASLTATGTLSTIGHGLGVKPAMVLAKNRDLADGWLVWHQSLASQTDSYLRLNTTAAVDTFTSIWGNGMTSTVIGVRPLNFVTATQNVIFYVFAEVPGFSRFGSYTGNGSADGPFVFCGFRPAYVMIKNTSASGEGHWVIKDKLRAAQYNPQDGNLYANLSNAEDTVSTVNIDFLSNGFKIRGTYTGINNSSITYIFAAFAEAPQKFALAR